MLFSVSASASDAGVEAVSETELKARIEAYRGKPLVLVYWASWCVPCRNYKEKLAALRELYPETELSILGLSVDTDPDMLREYMAENTLPFPTLVVTGEHYRALAGTPIPTTDLYDGEGVKKRTLTGNVDAKRLRHFVKRLFIKEQGD